MNYSEDLEFRIQKVTLAMQEVIEDFNITGKERQERIKKTYQLQRSNNL